MNAKSSHRPPSPPRYQDLTRFVLPNAFRGRSKITVQVWWIVQATLFGASPQFLFGFRRWLLRCFGAHIGIGVLVRPTARITYPWHLNVGDHSWIGDNTIVYNLAPVTIGSNVALAHGVYLCTGSHDVSVSTFDISAKPICIEDEAWLANDCFVGPGVTIHRGVVVGARSTVLCDMPEGMICVGYPARPIRSRLIGEAPS
jgi:putative colanic acid biosynthesis acetyltransferase WcaF